jgi:hypothetical protein
MKNKTETISHEEACELLPWLVNDSLAASERAALLLHVRSCMECRRESKQLEREQAIMSRQNDTATLPEPDVQKLMRRIEDYEERRSGTLSGRLLRFGERYRPVALLAPAAAVFAILLVVFWPRIPQPQFTTLTRSEVLPPGSYVRAVFDSSMTDSDVVKLLTSLELTIVSGPSPKGVYTLGAAGGIPPPALPEVTQALRNRTEVLFAEPLNVGAAP